MVLETAAASMVYSRRPFNTFYSSPVALLLRDPDGSKIFWNLRASFIITNKFFFSIVSDYNKALTVPYFNYMIE